MNKREAKKAAYRAASLAVSGILDRGWPGEHYDPADADRVREALEDIAQSLWDKGPYDDQH